FDPLMGARPMSRLIQDTIRSALADELLFGKLASGGKVTVDLAGEGKIRLDFEEEDVEATVCRLPFAPKAVQDCTAFLFPETRMTFKTPDLCDQFEAELGKTVRVVAPMFQRYGGRT